MLSSIQSHIKAVLIWAMLLASPLSFAEGTGLSGYSIGSGDMLSIQVFGEEDLSIEVRLSDAGTISYPFLGELRAKGLSIGELSEIIRSKLADGYLISPSVNVTVLEYRQFFINGEVEKPGGYPYQPGLTLQKAVALAGGFTERASKTKLYVVPDGKEGEDPVRIKLGTMVRPGDIITVEESFF